jgi:hypothetical protein
MASPIQPRVRRHLPTHPRRWRRARRTRQDARGLLQVTPLSADAEPARAPAASDHYVDPSTYTWQLKRATSPRSCPAPGRSAPPTGSHSSRLRPRRRRAPDAGRGAKTPPFVVFSAFLTTRMGRVAEELGAAAPTWEREPSSRSYATRSSTRLTREQVELTHRERLPGPLGVRRTVITEHAGAAGAAATTTAMWIKWSETTRRLPDCFTRERALIPNRPDQLGPLRPAAGRLAPL